MLAATLLGLAAKAGQARIQGGAMGAMPPLGRFFSKIKQKVKKLKRGLLKIKWPKSDEFFFNLPT